MINYGRALRRGSIPLMTALVAALLSSGLAAAAPIEPAAAGAPSVAIGAGAPHTAIASVAADPVVHRYDVRRAFERVVRTYGSATDAAKVITISAETTEVVLDPDIRLRGPEVYCGPVLGSVSPLAGLFALSDEWQANPTPTVAVLPGAVVAGSGAVFGYGCNSGEEESDRVVWQFVEGAGAGETVTLGSADALLTERVRTLDWAEGPDADPPIPVAFGDGFVVAGAPGLWPTATDTTTTAVMLASGGGAAEVPLETQIDPDGSALTFSLPADIDPRYLNADAEITVSAESSAIGVAGSTEITRTYWAAYVYFAGQAKVASHIGATLDRTYTVSVLRPRLTVTVTAAELPADTGFVAVNIDGTDQIVREIAPSLSTRFTVSLPKLPRGIHQITVRYGGSNNVAESVSGTLRLRVLV